MVTKSPVVVNNAGISIELTDQPEPFVHAVG